MNQIHLSELNVEMSFTSIHPFGLKTKKDKLKTIVT